MEVVASSSPLFRSSYTLPHRFSTGLLFRFHHVVRCVKHNHHQYPPPSLFSGNNSDRIGIRRAMATDALFFMDDNSPLSSPSPSPSGSGSKKNNNNKSDCSVKKAFSWIVFMIRELQSYSLQLSLRSGGLLMYESSEMDVEGIMARVHSDMNSSFCWLFQRIFSCTPALMLSLMLLLANFTLHSLSSSNAFALSPSPSLSPSHHHHEVDVNINNNTTEIINILDSISGGGGRKANTTVSGATDDGRSPVLEEAPVVVTLEEEAKAWKRIVDEAARMQTDSRHEALMDQDTLLSFVSPTTVQIQPDRDYYLDTDAMYRSAVEEDPHNPLLLSNYAHFLFQVQHDLTRAEYYFKRSVEVKPADAEALSRYANFLWTARNDLPGAEETFLEAIAADPGNNSHAANYAHFLWNTGGEDTCYPLDAADHFNDQQV